MILCDTNILIEFYKGNQLILDALHKIGPTSLAVSVVTVGELYFGARNRRELSKIQVHLSQILQIPLDEEVSMQFVDLMEKYVLSNKISIPDALIASTAICKGLPVFTLNTKDFQYIPDLDLFNP